MVKCKKTASGKWTLPGLNLSCDKCVGSRAQVWHGTACKTAGGLTKKNLKMNKRGRIVSAKKAASAKRLKRLEKYLSNETQKNVDKVLVASGSLKASSLTCSLEALGHTVTPLAPSLFAFNLSDKRTHGLSGITVKKATISHVLPSLVADSSGQTESDTQTGPILITHRGLSGPAILRLSAWQARAFQDENYHFEIKVNWLGDVSEDQVCEQFNRLRNSKTKVKTKVFEQIPRRFWERLVEFVGIPNHLKWAQLPKDKEISLIQELISGHYSIQGKTTNKDEFVTCGGVSLNEIDFKTMESRLVPGLHFAGECLDIDGITGGYNFQAAWTGGRLAGLAMANEQV